MLSTYSWWSRYYTIDTTACIPGFFPLQKQALIITSTDVTCMHKQKRPCTSNFWSIKGQKININVILLLESIILINKLYIVANLSRCHSKIVTTYHQLLHNYLYWYPNKLKPCYILTSILWFPVAPDRM